MSADGYIKSSATNVTFEQVFHNDEGKSIIAPCCFPIEEQATINSFIARIGD